MEGKELRGGWREEGMERLRAAHFEEDGRCREELSARLAPTEELDRGIREKTDWLVERMRERERPRWVDRILTRYPLAQKEGRLLLQLAEALPRIPDDSTAEALLLEKLLEGEWRSGKGGAEEGIGRFASWGLTGLRALARWERSRSLPGWLRRGLRMAVRESVRKVVSEIVARFILAEDLQGGARRISSLRAEGYRFCWDMLGEAARTRRVAQEALDRYHQAIAFFGGEGARGNEPPELSLKLSALHPRWEALQEELVADELYAAVLGLCREARRVGIRLVFDAEESLRFWPLLHLFLRLLEEPELSGESGLGIVVQAYQKRALAAVELLLEAAEATERRFAVRLVKGAYWDAEIRRAQALGLPSYPVFTRKGLTELSYLACAKRLLEGSRRVFPQFATHNPSTVGALLTLAEAEKEGWEFQRLYGVAESLFSVLRENGLPVRLYIPFGSRTELFGYLARRLLENGVGQAGFLPVGERKVPPFSPSRAARLHPPGHPKIPRPTELSGPAWKRAEGFDWGEPAARRRLLGEVEAAGGLAQAHPLVAGRAASLKEEAVFAPADPTRRVGTVSWAGEKQVEEALRIGSERAREWERVPVEERAKALETLGDRLWHHRARLLFLLREEAGKTLPDGWTELQEAIDFCRYYAVEARRLFGGLRPLPGPSGERNQIGWRGRGLFACISPWNFPLSIFLGQIVAALAAGNAVVAKPAEQTPLVAAEVLRLALGAGIPPEVLHLLPGAGAVGEALVRDPRLSGVAFTGSGAVASRIAQLLASRGGALAPLIAETGGVNVMVVDATAAAEQAVDDILVSAFRSSGQRCSSLRLLLVQEEAAPRLLDLLAGAIEELVVGDPRDLSTDVGPVIERGAQLELEKEAWRLARAGKLLAKASLASTASPGGYYFCPQLVEIPSPALVDREIFGPILPVVRFRIEELEAILDSIARRGFGLTMGLETRLSERIRMVRERARVGNLYVNRPMIGAAVEFQPFGGEGLSGTGPKSGGPRYLEAFGVERVSSENVAVSGDPDLLLLSEEEEGAPS
ncbi:RHH-type transcriptional regulator, proline utilization regulon repressor / proline dehydrogenase / delta 1-pyrroline-5-carboxylate dehydrogenase [Methylacidimicrobium cyclopophantes]|uniref:RHH-type transcriptional regulator, proline utilization regulon repressor / proline dehydrogenase / delta 1-pyrroline-5-carboxylate dehydrogenase n=1 Tax=Methylacidimicrobium cyclopophantes TaxID=1041766 RepID=A0A5E6MMS1_9BACT|nr:bifunctional proline dehydrogenase/L-glutamate gamma-semialdehyde dehydrogenase PutA [Methylacidimicrobium cyclopophantes]VVM07341.1 RHH-type transcriptional regulator, proline utilization regulon repressor / proline dehydrogenase / delta 1-pyrroline-5-carboxylate dehydrogenase [Methylacidimicrobium cyclopophantes]